MVKSILFVCGILVVTLSLYNIISTSIRRVVNGAKTTEVLYEFRGKLKVYPVIGILLILMNFFMLNNNVYSENNNYIINILSLGYVVTFVKVIFMIEIFILSIDFALSLILKPVLFEEGIMCGNGKFITWEYIQAISCIAGVTKNKKYLQIKSSKDEVVYLMTNNEESDTVKEILYNKSGIVNKDIVTEYS